MAAEEKDEYAIVAAAISSRSVEPALAVVLVLVQEVVVLEVLAAVSGCCTTGGFYPLNLPIYNDLILFVKAAA